MRGCAEQVASNENQIGTNGTNFHGRKEYWMLKERKINLGLNWFSSIVAHQGLCEPKPESEPESTMTVLQLMIIVKSNQRNNTIKVYTLTSNSYGATQ